MGTTEPQGTSKRIRIVLCALIVLGVTAAMPASGFAADWTSKAAKAAPAADWTSKTVAPAADWTSRIAPAADWTS